MQVFRKVRFSDNHKRKTKETKANENEYQISVEVQMRREAVRVTHNG